MRLRWTVWGFMVCLVGWSTLLRAQTPRTQRADLLARTDRYDLPRQDNAFLLDRERARRRNDRAPRFATSIPVYIRLQEHGTWTYPDDNTGVWRLVIPSPGAHSLNLGFTDFRLPAGAQLRIQSADGTYGTGPLTAADNDPHGTYWTPALETDTLLLELQIPREKIEETLLTIGYVNHDFIGLSKVVSGSCNLDVICSSGQGWGLVDRYRDIIQSVGLMTVDGRSYCTGFLVNNARDDCRPFFMTAEHCDIDAGNAGSIVVYWNYQNSFCRQPGSVSSGGTGNGSFELTNSGATWRAEYRPSDMTLLELDDPVAPAANAFFAGWSNQPVAFTDTALTIHHPSNEEKRISFEYDKPYLGKWQQGTEAFDDGDHVIIRNWEVGTTEDGSSGGPLFNVDGQVIGQLHGGRAACSNTEFDAFGWFGTSWEGGNHPTNSLKYWLDPDRSGLEEYPGRWHTSCQKALDASPASQSICPQDTARFLIQISDAFEGNVFLTPLSVGIGLSVASTLETTYSPGDQVDLSVTASGNGGIGPAFVVLAAIDDRDTTTITLEVLLENEPAPFALTKPLTDTVYRDETVSFSWSSSPNANRYELVVATDSQFQDILYQTSTNELERQVPGLAFEQTYHWKVTAYSSCGQRQLRGQPITIGPDLRLSILEEPSFFCESETLEYTLQLGAGFSSPVDLSYTMNVPGTLRFQSPAGQPPGGGDSFTFSIAFPATPDTNRIQVTIFASDGKLSAERNLLFTLQSVPRPPNLLFPKAQEIVLPDGVDLEWSFDEQISDYQVTLARDSAMTDVVLVREVAIGFYALEREIPAGRYFWQVRARNPCGDGMSEVRSFRVQDNALGKLNETSIALEPNPATTQVQVHLSKPLIDATVSLYNVQGQLIWQAEAPEKNRLIVIPVGQLPGGVYVVRIHQRQASLSRRIVVHPQ